MTVDAPWRKTHSVDASPRGEDPSLNATGMNFLISLIHVSKPFVKLLLRASLLNPLILLAESCDAR